VSNDFIHIIKSYQCIIIYLHSTWFEGGEIFWRQMEFFNINNGKNQGTISDISLILKMWQVPSRIDSIFLLWQIMPVAVTSTFCSPFYVKYFSQKSYYNSWLHQQHSLFNLDFFSFCSTNKSIPNISIRDAAKGKSCVRKKWKPSLFLDKEAYMQFQKS